MNGVVLLGKADRKEDRHYHPMLCPAYFGYCCTSCSGTNHAFLVTHFKRCVLLKMAIMLFFYPLGIQPWSQDRRKQTRIANNVDCRNTRSKSRTNRAAIGALITSDAIGSLLARDVAHVVKTQRHAQNTTTLISSDVAHNADLVGCRSHRLRHDASGPGFTGTKAIGALALPVP